MDPILQNISKQTEIPVSEIPAPKTRHPFHKTPIVLMSLFILLVIGAFFTGAYYQGMSANKEAAKIAVVSPTPVIASPTPDPTAGWRIYTFPAFGISFKYPSTYMIGTEGVKGTAGEVSFATTAEELAGLKQCYIPGQKPVCKSYSLEVAVVVGSKKEFDSLSDFLSASTGMLPSDYDLIQFQGFPAMQLDREDDDKMSGIKKLFVDFPDKYVEFDMSSTTNLQENKKYFDLILKTIKFTDSAEGKATEFSLTDVKVGDSVASMEITSIEPYKGGTVSANPENAKVSFKGQETVSGRYYYGGPNEMVPDTLICFDKLDEMSLLKMPRIQGDGRNVWFCLDNTSFAASAFSPSGSSGIATIIIDNYTINYYQSEVYNTAKLVKVVEKK